MRVLRSIHLLSASGVFRTATFKSKEHLVLPVVAMVEGVIFPVNAQSPEFVPADVLSVAPAGWNGRPVFCDHPMRNGNPVLGNTPDLLENEAFGMIFNSEMKDNRLVMEAWIDSERATAIGGDAATLVTRIQAGKPIEISTGALVVTEHRPGVFNGKPYEEVWREITPDHLALLSETHTGACSIAMGCGVRTCVAYTVTKEGLMPNKEEVGVRTLRERLKSLFSFKTALKGFSDNDVRDELRSALKAIEPGYSYIEAVYESDKYVVYCVSTMDPQYMETYYRRDFTMDKTGAVTFSDRTEVEPVMSFEKVLEAGQSRAACSCQKPPVTGDQNMNRAERITALLGHSHSPIKNKALLEAATDADLDSLETTANAMKAAADAKDVADKAAKEAADKAAKDEADRAAATLAANNGTKKLTREEIFAADPSIASIVREHELRAATEKTELVTKLTTFGALTKEQLEAKPLEELRTLAAFAKVEEPVTDYSLRGVPRSTSNNDQNSVPAAPDLSATIKAARAS